MGDSLEISGNNAINGVELDGDKHCLNSGADTHCMSEAASGDFLVVRRMDDSGQIDHADAGEEEDTTTTIPPHITASPSLDDEHERCSEHEVDDDAESHSALKPSHSLSKVNDSDNRNDADAGENSEPAPLTVAASPSIGHQHEEHLKLKAKNEIDDNESIPLPIATSPSADGQHEGHLKQEVKNEVDGNNVMSNSNSGPSHSPSKVDDNDIRSDANTGENDAPMPLHNTARPSVDDKQADNLMLGVENGNNEDDTSCNISHDNVSDPSHSISDKRQPNGASDNYGEHDETKNEHYLVDQAADNEFLVVRNSRGMEILDDVECQSSAVQDDQRTSQKPASRSMSDTESVDFKAEDLLSATTVSKSDESRHTDESHVMVSPQLQLKHEDSDCLLYTSPSPRDS